MPIKCSAGAILVLAGLIGACQPSAPPTHSGARLRVEPVATIDLPAEFLETGPFLHLLSNGRVALTDNGTKSVYLLDLKTHAVVRRMGRSGQGPGEFSSPVGVESDSLGRLVVVDIAARRLSVFDSAGAFLTTVMPPGMPDKVLRFAGDSIALTWFGEGMQPVVGVVRVDGSAARVIVKPLEVDSSLVATSLGMTTPNIFLGATGRPDGTILVASPERYNISSVQSAGTMRHWSGRPELPAKYRSSEEVEKLVAMMRPKMAMFPPALRKSDDELRTQYRESPLPFLSMFGLQSDAANRLWVVTNMGNGDSTVVDLFDRDGTYLQSLSFPQRFGQMDIRDTTVAFISATGSEDDVPRLFVYALRED